MRESDFLLLMYESKRYLIYFPYHVFDEMCLKKPFSRICEINLVYIKKLFLEIYESKYCLSTYSPFFSA